MLHRRGWVATQEGVPGYTGVPGCLHGWSFWNRQKGEAELRVGLGVVGGRSEPFSQKLHSLLLEGMFMVGILFLKGDRKEYNGSHGARARADGVRHDRGVFVSLADDCRSQAFKPICVPIRASFAR